MKKKNYELFFFFIKFQNFSKHFFIIKNIFLLYTKKGKKIVFIIIKKKRINNKELIKNT